MTDDTPPWMQSMAHEIALKNYDDDTVRFSLLKQDIIRAMKEAAREVALFFAANPDKLKEMPRA